jgi:hypothetical protein
MQSNTPYDGKACKRARSKREEATTGMIKDKVIR